MKKLAFLFGILFGITMPAHTQVDQFDWVEVSNLPETDVSWYLKACDIPNGQVVSFWELTTGSIRLFQLNQVGAFVEELPSFSVNNTWYDLLNWGDALVLCGVIEMGSGNPTQSFVVALQDGVWEPLNQGLPTDQEQMFLSTRQENLYLFSSAETEEGFVTTIYMWNQNTSEWENTSVTVAGIVEDVISTSQGSYIVTRTSSQTGNTLEGVWNFDGLSCVPLGNVEVLGALGTMNRTRLHYNPVTEELWLSSRISGQGCFVAKFAGEWAFVGNVGPLDAYNDLGFANCWQTPVRVCSDFSSGVSVVQTLNENSWETFSELPGSLFGWTHTTLDGNFRFSGNGDSGPGFFIQRLLTPPCCAELPVDSNCPADIDTDGMVNTADLVTLLSQFGIVCN